MKIAMIGQKGMPAIYGGVEKHAQDLASRLILSGHKVIVYSRKWYTKKDDCEINGVTIKHLPSIHTKHLDTITHSFLATIHAMISRCDVIHYHGVGPSLVAWMPRLFAPKTKVIATFNSIDRYHQKCGWFAKFILRLGEWSACQFPHETITVSKGLYNYCLNEFKKETVYIPNGVELSENVEGDELIARFGLKKNEYLLMVSRLVPHKGAHVLIAAFNAFKKESRDNKLKLAIVGGSVHTEKYFTALREIAADNSDIVFTDFQSNETLNALYNNCAAFAHPSFNEGLPITVLQAMAAGRTVLLSAIEAHLELSQNAEIFFKENNVSDLKKKLTDFISWSDEKRKKIGEENRRIVAENYDWKKIVADTIEVYLKSAPLRDYFCPAVKVNISR